MKNLILALITVLVSNKRLKFAISIITIITVTVTSASASSINTCFGGGLANCNIGSTYFVDSISGNDTFSGKTQAKAWKTLGKVNSVSFRPGDRILFKAGGIWSGQLAPKGSGLTGNPIKLDMYSEGAKPVINAEYDDRAGAGLSTGYYILSLNDQTDWEISNLELNGNKSVGCIRGVCIFAVNQIVKHVYVKNCIVRNIEGGDKKVNGGIFYMTTGYDKVSSFDDILIQDNYVTDVNRTAITTDTSESLSVPITNAVIRGNFVDNIGGDGIVAKASTGTVVEYNIAKDCNKVGKYSNVAIWAYNAVDTVFQFNEAYLTRSLHDGQGFDADYMCRGTTFQYNYSHDNEGGFFLVCCFGKEDGSAYNEDITIRYNISQNDKARSFFIGGPVNNVQIYNNTVFIPYGENVAPTYGFVWGFGLPQNIVYRNNIFYNLGTGEYSFQTETDSTFENNLFYGNHPQSEPYDSYRIAEDPMFAAPGSGECGIDSVEGYKLMSGSPAIGAGMIIENNGGRDYWGNSVASNVRPNIGAYNGEGETQSINYRSYVYNTSYDGTNTVDYTCQLAKDLGISLQEDSEGNSYIRVYDTIYKENRVSFGEYLSKSYVIDMKFKAYGSGTAIDIVNAENAAKTVYMENEFTSGIYGTTLRKWANGTKNYQKSYTDKKFMVGEVQTVKIDHDYLALVQGMNNVKNNVYVNDGYVGSYSDYMYPQISTGSLYFSIPAGGYIDIFELKVTYKNLSSGSDYDGHYIIIPTTESHDKRISFTSGFPSKFRTTMNFKVNSFGNTKNGALYVYTDINNTEDTYDVYELTREWGVCRYIKNTGDESPLKITPVIADKVVFDDINTVIIDSDVISQDNSNGTCQIKKTFFLNGKLVTEDTSSLPKPDSLAGIRFSGTGAMQIYDVKIEDMTMYLGWPQI